MANVIKLSDCNCAVYYVNEMFMGIYIIFYVMLLISI